MTRLADTLVAETTPIFNVFLHSNELAHGKSGRLNSSSDAEGDACFERTRALLKHCIETHGAEPLTLTEAARRIRPTLA